MLISLFDVEISVYTGTGIEYKILD
jgi:hypothetical protein